MILADTGFIVGTISADDKFHERCIESLKTVRDQLVTTWPCITEAMHLVGLHRHESLRRQIEEGFLIVHCGEQEDVFRCCILMRQYVDSPMDLADASLVAAAESLEISQVLTFDRHFYAYRIHGNTPFQVMP